jgi:DNA primase
MEQYRRTDAGVYRPLSIREWVSSVNIREVVGRYVELDHRGRGHCPKGYNHNNNDAKPSFAVSERRQRWRCFREEVGGDAFDFLAWYHDVDKREAYRLIRHGFYR